MPSIPKDATATRYPPIRSGRCPKHTRLKAYAPPKNVIANAACDHPRDAKNSEAKGLITANLTPCRERLSPLRQIVLRPLPRVGHFPRRHPPVAPHACGANL